MSDNIKFIEKLRSSALRPTKQRVEIAKFLFERDKTFHFTVESLEKHLAKKTACKFALATIYNTVHAFKDKGYLKEITISSDKSYFDTNITKHHHFYDEDTNLLIDCNDNEIGKVNIKNNITGKKISSVEVLVRVASDTQNQD